MTAETATGDVARAIANDAVKLIAEYTGRGPMRARTTISGDWVFIALEDTLTKGERQLARNGHEDAVLATRKAYQRIMREDLQQAIERHTGKSVVAFMSDNHVDPDVAIEAFLLRSDGDGLVAGEVSPPG